MSIRALATVLFLLCSACSDETVTPHTATPEPLASPLPASEEQHFSPMFVGQAPYAVRVVGLTARELDALGEAMALVNDVAGGDLLELSADTSAPVVVEIRTLTDVRAGEAECNGVTCTIGIRPRAENLATVLAHELVHALGYRALDGSFHDATGLMAEVPGYAVSERLETYLQTGIKGNE